MSDEVFCELLELGPIGVIEKLNDIHDKMISEINSGYWEFATFLGINIYDFVDINKIQVFVAGAYYLNYSPEVVRYIYDCFFEFNVDEILKIVNCDELDNFLFRDIGVCNLTQMRSLLVKQFCKLFKFFNLY